MREEGKQGWGMEILHGNGRRKVGIHRRKGGEGMVCEG